LKSEAARSQVLALIDGAEVVVSNFRPGGMERMGFGYEALRRRNPGVTFPVGTSFGLEGPNRRKGGQDIPAQALTGLMMRTSDPALPTLLYSTALCDYSAGMHLVQGILLALLQRQKTGVGQL